jgi:hypothetical protein
VTTIADLETRSGQLDGIAALVRRKTEVELELRRQLVELVETTAGVEQRYVADELAIVLAESPRSTRYMIEMALCASVYPLVQALVEGGTWTVRHGDAVIGELGGLTGEQCRQVVGLVLRQTSARTPHQLRKATRAAVYLVDPEAAEKAAEKAKQDRSVTAADIADGSATLFMNGPKAAIALAMAGLDALAVKAGPEDTRTLLQRRFDTLMLLITGQLTATGAQVQVLISLATLQGDDTPAEVPGYGFITAGEGRELVEQAESVRRVVTDDQGQLVSVDSTVETAPVAQDQTAAPLMSDEIEPEVTDDALAAQADELLPAAGDAAWLAQVQDDICDPEVARRRAAQELYDFSHPCPGDIDTPEQQAAQAQLHALLVVLTEQETLSGRPVGSAHVKIETDGSIRIHYSDDPHDPNPDDPGGGGTGPPEGPTQPLPAGYVDDRLATRERTAGTDPAEGTAREISREAHRAWLRRTVPSWTTFQLPYPTPEPVWPAPRQGDWDWYAVHPDRTVAHALIQLRTTPATLAPPPPGGWPSLPQPRKAWDTPQLHSVLATLLTRPVAPLPAASSSYPFRGALARHLKMRDQTCRFPGCTRLATYCDCDHRIPWPAGPTSVINGVIECEHHHQCKHAILTLTRFEDGTLRWTIPTGHYADTPPRALLRGW